MSHQTFDGCKNRMTEYFHGLKLTSLRFCCIFLPLFPSSCSEVLSNLKAEISKSKEMKVAAVRPLILAAEENLHNMRVDLDKVVTKV